MALSDKDRAVLDFERSSWQRSGPKESLIRSELGMSSTRYYQVLNDLLDDRDAYAYDPLLLRRLRLRRDMRRKRRIVGREVGPGRH